MDSPTRTLRPAAGLLAVILASACSVDAFTPTTDGELTLDESLALVTQLGLERLGRGLDGSAMAARAPGPQPGAVTSVTYDVTQPCPRGGTVRSFGNVRSETDQGPPAISIADVEATEIHDACVFQAGDTDVAISGDPSVTTTVHAANRDGRSWGPQTVAVVGGVRWVADDGRAGRCDMDIWVSADDDAGQHTVRGSFCGHSFDVTVDEGR